MPSYAEDAKFAFKKEICIHAIFSSPAHNYFTNEKYKPGSAPDMKHNSILLRQNKGITGDRFEDAKYPLTFFSYEVAQEIAHEFDLPLQLELYRRNIIISGINLCELIGEKFLIGEVLFEGIQHCAPCPWMNAVMKKGVYSAMQGRGGLRARVLNDGMLHLGKCELSSYAMLEKSPTQTLNKPKIPSL